MSGFGGGRRGSIPRRAGARPRLRADPFEAVEYAGVRAEELVAPHLDARGEAVRSGFSIVFVFFHDDDALAAFRAAGVVQRWSAEGAWELVRTWCDADGDAYLDEGMGTLVASHLNRTFAGRLRARVFTWLDEVRDDVQ